jgi:phthiocerol/phenolphthiocerol synthesis type-I polyketide synthase E
VSRPRLALLSALDAPALKARIEGVADFLALDSASQDDTLYTLAVGRKRLPQRAAFVIPSDAEPAGLLRGMERAHTERTQAGPGTKPNVAFMFPGQGSQFVGMGRELFQQNQTFRDAFLRCDRLLAAPLGLSLETLLFQSEPSEENSTILRQTRIAQPALFVVEYCLAQVLIEHGIRPHLLIGHSIGEFVAACLAGVFALEDALELVAERGRLMQSQAPGAMVAVRCTPDRLDELLTSEVTLAAHNAPDLCVVSGDFEPMNRFREAATAAGFDVRDLHTSHAFHSPMMEPILEPFRQAVARAHPRPPHIPIVSTLTGRRMSAEEATSSEYWARQLRQAVRFADGVRELYQVDDLVLVEVGPGTALASSAAKQPEGKRPRAILESLGGPKDPRNAMEATLRCLGRLWLQGAELDARVLYDGDQRRLVRLPTYPFTRLRHWVTPPTATGVSSGGPQIAVGGADEGSVAGPGALAQRVMTLLGSRLGRGLDEADYERSFVELGFDSLALSQLRRRRSGPSTLRRSRHAGLAVGVHSVEGGTRRGGQSDAACLSAASSSNRAASASVLPGLVARSRIYGRRHPPLDHHGTAA